MKFSLIFLRQRAGVVVFFTTEKVMQIRRLWIHVRLEDEVWQIVHKTGLLHVLNASQVPAVRLT